jgi:hypothetical protein
MGKVMKHKIWISLKLKTFILNEEYKTFKKCDELGTGPWKKLTTSDCCVMVSLFSVTGLKFTQLEKRPRLENRQAQKFWCGMFLSKPQGRKSWIYLSMFVFIHCYSSFKCGVKYLSPIIDVYHNRNSFVLHLVRVCVRVVTRAQCGL